MRDKGLRAKVALTSKVPGHGTGRRGKILRSVQIGHPPGDVPGHGGQSERGDYQRWPLNTNPQNTRLQKTTKSHPKINNQNVTEFDTTFGSQRKTQHVSCCISLLLMQLS